MIDKDKYRLRELIEKTNEGKISKKERQLLEGFMRQEFEDAEWISAEMGSKNLLSATIYSKLPFKKTTAFFPKYYKYAVAAMVLFCLSIATLLLRKDRNVERTFAFNTGSSSDSLKLSDGTVVFLAAHSSFAYPAEFKGDVRSVSLLKGNAFFKVTKDPEHPFIINSGDLKTKVLGTTFHISLEKEESRVTVVTGRVNVSSKKETVELTPNEEAIYSTAGLIKQKTSNELLSNWYQKDIELQNVSVRQVLKLLNYRYGAQFRTQTDEILEVKLTIYLQGDLALQNILNQINYITNLKFKQHEKIIEVTN